MKWSLVCAWRLTPATIAQCNAGAWIEADRHCLDLLTSSPPARMCRSPGSWVTIFIQLKHWKRKRHCCQKLRAKVGSVCFITIPRCRWDESWNATASWNQRLLRLDTDSINEEN